MTSFKQLFSNIVAMAKAKSTAVKSKTSAIKTRLVLFKLLHDKKVLMTVISQKVHAVKAEDKLVKDYNIAALPYKSMEVEEEEEEYLYVTNPCLELVGLEDKDCNDFDGDFILENEIDKAADTFIRRFHRQILIQKQESFKRHQEMLERSVQRNGRSDVK